eukprot:s240_g27.t1
MCGYLATYVDDMLMVGPQPLLRALMTTIGNKWECSSQEFAEADQDLRFCGMEIRKTSQGFDIHQSSYVMDLLARYEVAKYADVPMGKVDDLDEEEEKKVELSQLRQAQQLAGELIWISTRTRVDIAFAAGAMPRRLHKDPEGALKIGEQILAYLHKYPALGISYSPCEPTEMDDNQVPRMMDTVEVFADVSYAPGGEAYRSIQGVLTRMGGQIIQWHTGRQSLIATSTAEGELLAYQEGQIMGASVETLAQAMALDPDVLMYGDNKAAISLAVLQTGSWRTRHLRVRASKLREVLRKGSGKGRAWQIRRMAGTLLVADGLTKALQKQAFEDFLKKLKMSASDRPALNKMEKIHDIPKEASDMLYGKNKNEVYYKKMMALALAALALLLTGELQTAAVVLIALKCCNKIYEELCKRAKAPLPQELSTSNKKEFKKFEPVRFTVIFYDEGGRSKRRVIKDNWTGTPTAIDYGEWKGYTVFKLKDQPEVAPTQLDPEESAPSTQDPRASGHVACGREEESLTCGPVTGGREAPALSIAFPESGGYGARSSNQPGAKRRGQVALQPQPKAAPQESSQGSGDLEEVMRGLQLLGRHYPQAGQVQGAAQVQSSAHLRDAAQQRGDAQQRGADQLQRADRALRSGQVRGADGALQAAALAEDPISDFDDSFELIADDAPQPHPALRAFRFCGGEDSPPPPHSTTARGSRERSPSTEVRVGQHLNTDDEIMNAGDGSSSSSKELLPEDIDPPPGQRGICDNLNPWNGLPLGYDPWAEDVPLYPPRDHSVQAQPESSETGVQVGSPRIAMSVASSSSANTHAAPETMSTASSWIPTDPKARPRKAPPPPQSPWVQATIQELRQLRRENRMLQELLEPGALQRDDVATVSELVEAAQGWRHNPKSQPNPKTQPLSVLRPEGAVEVDVDATLSGPTEMPGISTPPVLVGASDLPHVFSAFPPVVRPKAPPEALRQQTQQQPPPAKPPPKAVFFNPVVSTAVPIPVMPQMPKPKPPHPPKNAAEWLGGSLFQ